MKAALYLRSSKDKSDVSIAAQRHELQRIASSRSFQIVRSFEDAVESGATEDRPGFIALLRAIRDPQRGWTHLLVYDTSRIARRRHIAQAFKHETQKRGVTIVYAKLPSDLDPISEIILESVFQAMDEVHSLMSRDKGLAGMAENVRQGWRAGGRAPMGYRLDVRATGAVRDGKSVTKSKLELDELAPRVRSYLEARAAGVPRVRAIAASAIGRSASTMISVEWNALTYAGHTVWNRHAPQETGKKRRGRDAWQITRNTHPAIISDAQAEAILAQLETSSIGQAVSRAKALMSDSLLSGLLQTSDGQLWVAHGKYYRLKKKGRARGRLVPAGTIERAVRDQVAADCSSDLFLKALLQAGRRHQATADPAAVIDEKIEQLELQKAKAAKLALESDAETFLKLVTERTNQIAALRREAIALRNEATLTAQTALLTTAQLRQHLAEQDPARAIQTLVERIILEPDLTCRLQYKALGARSRWLSMASPGGVEPPLPP